MFKYIDGTPTCADPGIFVGEGGGLRGGGEGVQVSMSKISCDVFWVLF